MIELDCAYDQKVPIDVRDTCTLSQLSDYTSFVTVLRVYVISNSFVRMYDSTQNGCSRSDKFSGHRAESATAVKRSSKRLTSSVKDNINRQTRHSRSVHEKYHSRRTIRATVSVDSLHELNKYDEMTSVLFKVRWVRVSGCKLNKHLRLHPTPWIIHRSQPTG